MDDKGAILPTILVLLVISTSILLYINSLTKSHLNKLNLLEEHYENQSALLYSEQLLEKELGEDRPDKITYSFNTGEVVAEKVSEESYRLTIQGKYIVSDRDVTLEKEDEKEDAEEEKDTENKKDTELDTNNEEDIEIEEDTDSKEDEINTDSETKE